jgi:UDP-N-acetylglucosamine 4,6-dehydratase/5-epimerase
LTLKETGFCDHYPSFLRSLPFIEDTPLNHSANGAASTAPTLHYDTADTDLLDGKSVLVTGGTGSFGQKFIRTILTHGNPKRVAILSRDEYKQYQMAQEFAEIDKTDALRFLIGDVRDANRLDLAFRGVDYVVHAAALKQVPTAEYNPFECINTNVLGAENVVQAAIRNQVKCVLALSTDKAANPINLYGASKLASDKIFIAANNMSGDIGTRFAAVRYGNVIGSRGSVVELYQRLVSEGATSLPVTDERMTRFWITIQQGVNFVLSSMKMMRGGEIFVPKVPSMKVTDVAKAFLPNADFDIIGIRPGEKLHEALITLDDARNTIELDDRFILEPEFAFWSRKHYSDIGAKPVPEDFSYVSNVNDDWLDADSLNSRL